MSATTREQLRDALAAPGVTQVAIAAAAGVTQACISRQACGVDPVTAEVLAAAESVRRQAISEGLVGLGIERARR